MSSGANRIIAVAQEANGWGGFHTTLKNATIGGATTMTLNGRGGPTFGTAEVKAGMTIYFPDVLNETPKVISAVDAAADAGITVPALTQAHSAGEMVIITYAPSTTILAEDFSLELSTNPWETGGYTGTRAKVTRKEKGQKETSASFKSKLRPNMNARLIVNAYGRDRVIGLAHGTPVNTTANGAVAAGATTVTFQSATGFAANDYFQIEADTSQIAEIRKVVSVATNTVTVDAPLKYAHATGVAIKKLKPGLFGHKPIFGAVVPSFTILDFVPADDLDPLSLTGMTPYAYIAPGAVAKSFSLSSDNSEGIDVQVDYLCQNKELVPAPAGLTVKDEAVFTFDEEAVLILGQRNYRVTSFSMDCDNDAQPDYTKHGWLHPFQITAGQQAAGGEFKFLEDKLTQLDFWTKWNDSVRFDLDWKVTDLATGYYVRAFFPQASIDNFNDGNLSASDRVNAVIQFTGELDGTTNTQFQLEVWNGDHLQYS